MNTGGSIAVEGLDALLKDFVLADKAVRQAAFKGLAMGGADIVADAQVNLRNNRSVVTGLLRQSGKVQKKDDTTLDAGFFDTTNQSGYALYVEYGRRAGKFPPLDMMIQWARKKFRLQDKETRTVGFLTARKIAKEGSTPHPFLTPAVKKNQNNILKRIREAVRQATD